MELVSACPFPVGSIVWQAQSGAVVLTVACKTTFQLKSIVSPLADEQAPIVDADRYWNDDPRQPLLAPSDLAPWKRRADVLVTGSVRAPDGDAVRSLIVRISVAGVEKAMEIFGDRVFSQDGYLREGARFTRSTLDWRYAAGGPDSPNPVGIRHDAPRDTYGQRLVPRFQPTGLHVTTPDQVIPAIGFGPIAPTWPDRWNKLYRHAHGWDPARWFQRPLPDDLDPAYFNAAPPDQQAEAIRPDERIVLENLHPRLPRLVTNLAPITPQAIIERPGRPPEGAGFVCDTMWIDADKGTCSLTWRTRIVLESVNAPGRVWVTLPEEQAQAVAAAAAEAQAYGPAAAPVATYASAAQAPAYPGAAPAPADPAAPAAAAPAPAAPVMPVMPKDPGPRGLERFTVDRCAAIAASYARRVADREAILKENGLSEDDWDAVEHHWAQVLKRDATLNDDNRLVAYDLAFVERLEKERGPITPEEYARLALHEHDRGALARALSELGLPWGCTQRIQRVYAERMARDTDLAAKVRAAKAER